jgi:hypothetical protein
MADTTPAPNRVAEEAGKGCGAPGCLGGESGLARSVLTLWIN